MNDMTHHTAIAQAHEAHGANDTPSADGPAVRAGEDLGALLDATVMIVDDEELNIEVTQVHLEAAGYTKFVTTSEPMEALGLLAERRPDVLLLDLMMPGISGFEIMAKMRERNVLQDVPTIVLTASTDAATKLKVLELGATDFLAKPVDASELLLRLKNTLAAKAYRDRLANYDLLTGLPNRQTFMDRLSWALRYSARYGTTGAVLHIALDKFRQVNEALGPAVGDTVLASVARRLEQCLRTTDTVGIAGQSGPQQSLSRLSGDEFTVVLPVLGPTDDAARIAARVLSAIAQPLQVSGHEIALTASVGIAVFPADGQEIDCIVKNAGAAMHHAKKSGKNTYRFYAAELNARALQKLSLANELRKALERDELRLYYQPKVDVTTGEVCGAEALVRWQHPERGLVPPNEFIALAEENGLIVALGNWVMRAACRQSVAWQSAGYTVPRIAVNVSSHQIRERGLPETFRAILGDTGAQAVNLTVELTEGVVMDNTQANVDALNELKAMGFKLSIDDFGTGYSSLSYLHRLPLDELKIDRSFVMEIKTLEDRAAIITAIIAMAHSLGLRVVAEGVETEVQLALLRTKACDEFQGYLKSKPLPADEFTARFLAPA